MPRARGEAMRNAEPKSKTLVEGAVHFRPPDPSYPLPAFPE